MAIIRPNAVCANLHDAPVVDITATPHYQVRNDAGQSVQTEREKLSSIQRRTRKPSIPKDQIRCYSGDFSPTGESKSRTLRPTEKPETRP